MLSNQFLVNNYSASGLAPVSGQNPSILILGCYPSVQSLQRKEYYGNPRNQFWKIMGMVFSFPADFPELPYQERLDFLTREGIAIWDVVESCSRKGSSDSSICDATPNDIRGFLAEHPSIRCIALNGKTGAGHWFGRYFSDLMDDGDHEFVVLSFPSTSPANARMSIGSKTSVWQEIHRYCSLPDFKKDEFVL